MRHMRKGLMSIIIVAEIILYASIFFSDFCEVVGYKDYYSILFFLTMPSIIALTVLLFVLDAKVCKHQTEYKVMSCNFKEGLDEERTKREIAELKLKKQLAIASEYSDVFVN